ncbi:MAG: metalloregulator ArsR/SmtB family transcription factor [Rhizobiaceae bacterium]
MACCSSPDDTSKTKSPDNEKMATVFAALSNPARIDILRHIAKHRHCGCKDITEVLPLAQSTVSQHLKVLIEAGIIIAEAVPPRSQYQVNEELLKDMAFTTSTFLDSCCTSKCC